MEEAEILNSSKILNLREEKLLPLKVSVQIFLLISHVMVQSAYCPGSPFLSHPGMSGGVVGGAQSLVVRIFFPGWSFGE